MSLSQIYLGMLIGQGIPLPAPGSLMRALRHVEVTQQDSAPCGFQLTFLAEATGVADNFSIVDEPLLQPWNRVVLGVLADGVPTPLIDGFITHQQYMPSNGPGDSTFVVTGEDVSVQMDLDDVSGEYPAMPDAVIVAEILAEYALQLGLIPLVEPPPSLLVPKDYVPQQSGTDRALIQEYAQRNGYVFYVTPTDVPLANEAYWGPPLRELPPSAVLDVAVGAASTVDGMQGEYNALAPETFYGLSMSTDGLYEPVPVGTLDSTRWPLATRPALSPLHPLATKSKLWTQDQLDPERAELVAQALTNASTDSVVTVSCEVSPVRLGQVVSAPSVVGVRGTGESYDGLYYLKSATHKIDLLADQQWNYTQSLVMTREGLGTTTPVLEAL